MTSVLAWAAWAFLGTVLAGAIWIWLRRTHELFAPSPIFLGTIALYALPRSAYLLVFRQEPLTSGGLDLPAQELLIAETLGLMAVGVVAFLAGHARPSAARVAAHLQFNLPDPEPRRAFWVAAAAAIVGGAALAHLLSAVGGVAYALRHQYELGVLLGGKQPIFQITRLLIVPVALLLVHPSGTRSRLPIWLIAVAVAIALFPLGRRGFLVLALGYPVALYHLKVRRLPLRWLAVGGVIAGSLIMTLAYVRALGGTRLSQAAAVFTHQPLTLLHFAFNATGEMKSFDAATIIVKAVPDEISYTAGATFARVPFMIIPRQLWQTKPVTLGETVVRHYLPHLKTGYPPLASFTRPRVPSPFCLAAFCSAGWHVWRGSGGDVGRGSAIQVSTWRSASSCSTLLAWETRAAPFGSSCSGFCFSRWRFASARGRCDQQLAA
jgi:hypothetical protein